MGLYKFIVFSELFISGFLIMFNIKTDDNSL